jgi:flagellar biosynthesis chaperone FliJ
VAFEWKEDGRPDIGLIAEEVGAVLPEIVEFEENGTDAKSVNYSRLVSVLIEAVKVQQQQLDARDLVIEEVMSRLDRLEQLSQSSTSSSDPTGR